MIGKLIQLHRRIINEMEKRGIAHNYVNCLDYLELIKETVRYDPSKPNNAQLADNWRIVMGWYATYKRTNGKGIKFSKETIINIARIIYNEISKRIKEGRMKHEFNPEKMKPYSKELYNIVSKKILSEEEIEKIENLQPLLNKFQPIVLVNNFVSLVGSQVKRKKGHKPTDIDLHTRLGDNFTNYLKRAIQVRTDKMLDEKTAELVHWIFGDPEGSHDTFVPLYHLALIPADRKIVIMSKEQEDILTELKVYSPQKPYGSAYYEIDKALEFIKEGKEYLIEYKFNGFHAIAIKKGNDVKIYSEQKKELTKAFPTLTEAIKKLSTADFMIDGELVPYDPKTGKALGRNELMKYMGAVRSGKPVDDSNIKLHVWDIIYYNKDIKNLPLRERLNYLKKLRFTNRITDAEHRAAHNVNEARKLINWATNLKNSEGAVIKDLDAPYTYGESKRTWIKFRHLTPINVVVIKRVPKERGLYNYLVGVPATKKYLNPKYIQDKKLVLGHSFNTKEKFEVNDRITILIEEVWRHETKGGVHYSIHKPRVKGKTGEALSSIDYLEDIVTSIGVVVTHAILFDQEILISQELAEKLEARKGEEGKEIAVKDFPKRMQNNFKQVMEKKLWLPFVIQWHLRGEKSLHSDHRFEIPSGYLEGFTYFTPASMDKPDLLINGAKNIRGTIKVPQPIAWLKAEGRYKAGAPGTTTKYDAFFTIVSKGKYTIHEVTDHKIVFELKSDKGKVKKFDEKSNPEPYIKELNKKLPDSLKQLSGKYIFMIAHIGEKHIMLLNKLKEK